MIDLLALSALTTLASATPLDAPDRLISQHGVELVADERVFMLFAALNVAGYSEETERRGPPLRAPVYHPIRIQVRDKLRSVRDRPAMDGMRKVFSEHPGEVTDYLQAVLAEEGTTLDGAAKTIQPALDPALERFAKDAKLKKVFDDLALTQRTLTKQIKAKIEANFGAVSKTFGLTELRGPSDLVVIANPLDAHASEHRVTLGKTRFLIVGPKAEAAGATIVKEAMRPAVQAAVAKAYRSAQNFAKSWDAIKISRRITERYVDGPGYLTEALTTAMVHRLDHGKTNKEADEDFIDVQAKLGNRWARAALIMLDAYDGNTPFAEALPKLTEKVRF